MVDRSSRPHRQPNRTPAPVVRKIVHLRWKQRLGPVQIGDRLGMPASTVHAVLVRCRLNRLTHLDRATGEPVRRYEHEHPGDLIHVDVKKLGNVPDGGGWRYVGRAQGDQNRAATAARTGATQQLPRPTIGHRLRAHRDRRPLPRRLRRDPRRRDRRHRRPPCCATPSPGSPTAASPSNGCCPTTAAATAPPVARHLRRARHHRTRQTRPYRPQTNGKIERFHRTMADGWAFRSSTTPNPPAAQLCQHGSTSTTTTGPTPPSANAPITRLDNLAGHHS